MKMQVLVVDDNKLANESFAAIIGRLNHQVDSVFSGEEAVSTLQTKEYDIVLTDLKMEKLDGIEVLKEARKLYPEIVVIVITAFGTVENAVKAIKLGAYDYLLKPADADKLELIFQRAAELVELRKEVRQLKTDLGGRYHNIIGKSPRMNKVYQLIDSTANARSTVLITGESGTGKELVARAIHYNSDRKEMPFIKLNCAAVPENLVESELFGYEKGAFTGAYRQHKGKFEMAHGGTLLLDEISEMPIGLQAKLLRVLQEREIERIGSADPVEIDVRIVATSNRNLKKFIEEGRFREDLYFRLNVIPINIAPLRERLDDIPKLTDHFIKKYNEENGKNVSGVDESVYRMFMKYHWPGNVRELENYIERAVVISPSEILQTSDFPSYLALGKLADEASGLKPGMTLADTEKYMILKTLEQYKGNKTKAAEVLNITPRTIRNKLAEYNIEGD